MAYNHVIGAYSSKVRAPSSLRMSTRPESPEAYRVDQCTGALSNSSVKKRGGGSGVDIPAGDDTGDGAMVGVSVAGTIIGMRRVAVAAVADVGSGVAGWLSEGDRQAVVSKKRHPIRIFFMGLFITQLSSKKRWTIRAKLTRYSFSKLIAVWNAEKTGKLVDNDASP